jgi:outer membrane lipoprotein SlyB
MDMGLKRMHVLRRNGMLYPMLLIAAVSVIIFSACGIAMMTGLLPHAESIGIENRDATPKSAAGERGATPPPPRRMLAGVADKPCLNCGVIESITPVEVKGQGSGLGMVAGGVTGLLLGNQIGRGNGNAIATVAGAAGGAFAGNEIEKNMKKSVRYQVQVQMGDGTRHTSYQTATPAYAVGDRVRVVNGQIVVAG